MALKSCRECGEQVSSEAHTCPKCGITKPAKEGKKAGSVTAVVVFCFFLILISNLVRDADKPQSAGHQPSSNPLPNIGSLVTPNNAAFGCVDKPYLEGAVKFAVEHDEEAYGKYFIGGLANGECRTFEKNDVLYVQDVSVFDDVIQVREKGQTQSYWLFHSDVK